MKTFNVVYYETIRHNINVIANNEKQAEIIAEGYYIDGMKTQYVKEHTKETTENNLGWTEEIDENENNKKL
jgi:fructose-1-phosphate kinase PfkB-like protein